MTSLGDTWGYGGLWEGVSAHSPRYYGQLRGMLAARRTTKLHVPYFSVTLSVTLTFFVYFGSGPSGGWCGGEREDMGDGGQ